MTARAKIKAFESGTFQVLDRLKNRCCLIISSVVNTDIIIERQAIPRSMN